MKDLLLILSGVIFTAASMLLPVLPVIPDILIRSSIIAIPFLATVYYLNLSEEIRRMIDETIWLVRGKK
jgi:hypothetical protein